MSYYVKLTALSIKTISRTLITLSFADSYQQFSEGRDS